MGPAGATHHCGDHPRPCAIDDWRWSVAAGGFPGLERVATRDTGGVRIRRCGGERDTPKLPGTAGGRMESVSPSRVLYVTQPRGFPGDRETAGDAETHYRAARVVIAL